MKTSEFVEVLNAQSNLLEAAGCRSSRVPVLKIAKGLAAFGETPTVAASLKKSAGIVETVTSLRPSEELDQLLQAVEATFEKAKAKSAAKDVSLLRAFLHDNNLTADAAALVFQAAATLKKKTRKKAAPNFNPAEVRKFADDLTSAVMNKSRFDALIGQLSSRSKSQAETYAIADGFLGTTGRYRSKKEAIDRIKKRQFQDVLHETRGEIIDRLRV